MFTDNCSTVSWVSAEHTETTCVKQIHDKGVMLYGGRTIYKISSLISLFNIQQVLLLLVDEGRSSGRLVLPGGGKDTNSLVVSRKTVDSRLDQNKAELRVHVLSVLFQVLSDGDSLLDEVVKVLRDLRSKTYKNATLSANNSL